MYYLRNKYSEVNIIDTLLYINEKYIPNFNILLY